MSTDPYKYFRIEAHELIEQLSQAALVAEASPDASAVIGKMLRLAHTLKGAARVVRLVEIAERAHAIEDVLGPARRTAERLARDRVDEVLGLVDEIRLRLVAIAQPGQAPPAPAVIARVSGPTPRGAQLIARHDTPRPALTRDQGEGADGVSAAPPARVAPSITAPSGMNAAAAAAIAAAAAVAAAAAPKALVSTMAEAGALGPPEPTAAAPPEVSPHRHDSTEIDELLDGVGESQAHLSALRESAGASDRARRLLRTLSGHLDAPRGRDHLAADRVLDRARSLAAELDAELSLIDRAVSRSHELLDRELRRVRDGAEQLRLTPARALVHAVERTVRNDARAQGKSVRFEARGAAVRLEATAVATLQDALIQVTRNAVVHGIEPEAERRALGKPAEARIALTIERHEQRVTFSVSDDGRGVDVPAVRDALRARSPRPAEIDALSTDAVLEALIGSGISTSPAITELSGRGVGLDIVGDVASRLQGTARLRTEAGRGTTVEIVVPLTLAAVEALMVVAGGMTVALPLESVRHATRYAAEEVAHTPEGDRVVLDGQALPFASLASLLDRPSANARGTRGPAVIVETRLGAVAVGIDRALSAARVVVRPLPELVAAHAVVAGASLDGAGEPQLVLDADAIVRAVQGGRSAALAPAAERTPILVIDDSLTTRMLEQSILEAAGYAVDLATSAEEGLELARLRPYALFLVDVEMPGMDGFTFVERIRADPALRGTPAILVTSRNAPEDLQRGRDAGAQDYMVKSEFDQNRLLARIHELVR